MLWATTDDADEYFSTRLNASTYWASGVEKLAALTTAQNQIEADSRFRVGNTTITYDEYGNPCETFAEFASGDTIPILVIKAVCEQALFLLMHGRDMDRRLGLQAQGVMSAGVVNESYSPRMDVPICVQTVAFLTGYRNKGAGAVDITR
jgi:hypothetical protein